MRIHDTGVGIAGGPAPGDLRACSRRAIPTTWNRARAWASDWRWRASWSSFTAGTIQARSDGVGRGQRVHRAAAPAVLRRLSGAQLQAAFKARATRRVAPCAARTARSRAGEHPNLSQYRAHAGSARLCRSSALSSAKSRSATIRRSGRRPSCAAMCTRSRSARAPASRTVRVLHVTHDGPYAPGGRALIIGDRCHGRSSRVLHACTIGNACLVGMGTIVLDDVVTEDFVMIGAGGVVTSGKRLTIARSLCRQSGASRSRAHREGDRVPDLLGGALREGEG